MTVRVRTRVRDGTVQTVASVLEGHSSIGSVPVSAAEPSQNSVTWTATFDAIGDVSCRAESNPDGGITLRAEGGVRLPYFHWALAPLWRHGIRTWLRSLAAESGPRHRHWQFSPVLLSPETAAALATVALLFALTTYCGSLFTQAGSYVSDGFGAPTTALTTALAVTRIGTLVALAGSLLADRHGRRRILLVAVAGVCLSTLATAAMPSFAAFTLTQTLTRGFVNLAATIAFVVLVEEAPDGARGWVIGLASFAGGFGFALGVVTLPIAEFGSHAWRLLFVLGGLGVVLLPGMARRLREPERFRTRITSAEAPPNGQLRQLFSRRYFRRFSLLAVTGFLSSAFVAASSQLFNPYLIDERGFSAVGIIVLRAVTQGPFTVVAVMVGARLADTRGRRPLMIVGAAAGTAATAAFFLAAGPWMWVAAAVGTTVGALGAPAWGTASGELFPTAARGTAGGALLVAGVSGSMCGLALAGPLSVRFDSLGTAIAVLALPALVATLVLVPFLPEGAGRELEELSPETPWDHREDTA